MLTSSAIDEHMIMKRYHVISISLLAGLIMGLSLNTAHATATAACVEDGAKYDGSALILTSENGYLMTSVMSEKVLTPGLTYVKGREAETKDGKATVITFTTRQKGQESQIEADTLALYFPHSGKPEMIAQKFHTDNKGVIHDGPKYACFDLAK